MVVVYRADTIDIMPARPEHILLVVEVVSPGSETTDRIVKAEQYARAGISYYWRVEQPPAGVPVVCTYVLDPATRTTVPVRSSRASSTLPHPSQSRSALLGCSDVCRALRY